MTSDEVQSGQILLVDKPLDWTSFQVVNKIRFQLKKEFKLKKIKVGHAGTLDPKATGLLVVCTGGFTKRISEIQNAPKEYRAEIKIGVQTESYDTEKPEILHKNSNHITEDMIEGALSKFIGKIEQKPPIFSAVKIEGRKAYDLVRCGEIVDMNMKSRTVNILYIRDTQIEFPYITFTVGCSKGTYIRSLAHDIGQILGVGAYLTKLRRTKIGNYDVNQINTQYLNGNFFFGE